MCAGCVVKQYVSSHLTQKIIDFAVRLYSNKSYKIKPSDYIPYINTEFSSSTKLCSAVKHGFDSLNNRSEQLNGGFYAGK